MPAKVYTDKDADLAHLNGKVCGVIGFGSQGHAHALNLKDSGVQVVVGLYKGSKSIPVAEEHGFQVVEVGEAARKADIIFFATPDLKSASIFEDEVAPHLQAGKALLFSHGFAVHFNTIVPPKEVDVIMVAPKGPGHIVRRQYLEGKGVPSLIAVYQNPSKQAKKLALAWAKGIGATRAGVLETTFKEETETDLFGEQTVLCGGLTSLVQKGFETLVEAGYQPEMAYFECLHELKLIVDLIYESGIAGMRFSVSQTAKWGDVSVGPNIIDSSVKRKMQKALKDIQSGKFAKGWIAEYAAGLPNYKKLLKDGEKHLIEKTGERLRGLMPWIQKKNIKGAQAAY
ncbi:MAG: ketol-acid reductoisomerase [Verrucomicrobia bacterium]|nr:ketol-acid reductoisomerase [Verrucomicrobiota bacterium]MBV9642632.1 ketol-acid reductoisomerase [Verrucomicrobiota bacterium]